MRKFRTSLRTAFVLALVAALGAIALVSSASGKSERSSTARAVPGEILVGFKARVSPSAQNDALADVGAVREQRFGGIRGALVSVDSQSTAGAIRKLERDGRVAYAEPNFVVRADVPNDPFLTRLWGLDNLGQTVNWTAGAPDADIDAREAWSVSTGSPNVVVAMIDTGVDLAHPDLAANIWVNQGEDCPGCRTNGLDDDGNGYVDDWRGWDFVNGDNNPTDDMGHGTHVAGTIAAVGNNGLGVAGVTWSTRVMPLKFLSAAGTGTVADAISAILYASANGASVLNNSWGGDEFSQALLDAIDQTDANGALFVAAAGNSYVNSDVDPNYPSGYEAPNVLSVGATDQVDHKAWFSNYGTKSVDLGAPGTNIYSTWLSGTYRFQDGTSMAAPHVSGAAALAKAIFPDASGVGLKALLLRTVDPLSALSGTSRTGGRLNVDRAARCSGSPEAWIESPVSGGELNAGEPLEIRAFGAVCGSPAGVSVSASVNGSPLELSARGDGLYTASPVLSAGPLTVVFSATAGGSTDTQSVSAMVTQSYDITPAGPAVTVTTHSAGENARLFFDGVAGQRVALRMSNVTMGASTCCSAQVSIWKPDGSNLVYPTLVGTNGGFIDTRALPVTGRYSVLVDPQGTAVGSMTLTLYDVPPDMTDSISPGGPAVTVSMGPVPGQNAILRFDGSAGQRVSVRLTSVTIGTSTCCSAQVSIWKPDGSNLVYPTLVGTTGGFLDTRGLPASGMYTILVDPQATSLGSMTLTLYDVPPDTSGSIVAGGGPVSLSLGPTPGQNATLRLDGTAGQRISLRLSNVTIGTSTCCGTRVSLLKPDGTNLIPPALVGTSGATMTATVPVTGQYSILVDPQAANTGGITLTLSVL